MRTIILDVTFHNHFTNAESGYRYIALTAGEPNKEILREFIEDNIVPDAKPEEYIHITDANGKDVAYVMIPGHNVDMV